ncbi:hypothetical protein PUNSTDRAFT_142009 [Punctularia strigosozonata HHB-11173 SS5]|uniref:uncharacterized protein n=1 Tax=Punctularia strigosozonata (strain HHB-11173) TaxID=741275 RepID=UPI00044178DD|nr:uncharacterized protein PUNSTDRAFT_142009 [Punctularia strigosozonata HHB-11173 SS5]EIN11745.1 hypothetical protein PUNSTDRAFT_142009 [Punctularia strigosozonata HHB-11173 SS5]
MNGLDTLTPLPRLRVHRTPSLPTGGGDDTPVAGPSRLTTHSLAVPRHGDGDDDDAESTPKIPTRDAFPPHDRSVSSQATATTTASDNPAARLRALLHRLPSETPLVQQRPPYARMPTTPSEPDSDFDPPDASRVAVHSHPSFAQDSLKDLFSNALRESSNTPQKGKGRPRRNSIDLSEVESATPERASFRGKTKRKSLSDDEIEKLDRSSFAFPPISRERPSTLSLLQRRQNSIDNEEASHDDLSADSAAVLEHLNSSAGSPPAATSTPLRQQQSIQLPSQIHAQSNLLDQDSDMHDAMNVLDSFESNTHSRALRATPSFSTLRNPNGNTLSPKRASLTTPFRHHSHPNDTNHSTKSTSKQDLSRRHSADVTDPSFYAASTQSNAELKERERELQKARDQERERAWNKSSPLRTPARPSTPSHAAHHSSPSPAGEQRRQSSGSHRLTVAQLALHNTSFPRTRKDSATSITSVSTDGEGSKGSPARSRTGSLMSNASFREMETEEQKERNRERERLWNAPAHSLQRQRSSLLTPPPAERTRTLSTPARPSSLSPGYSPSQHRASPSHAHGHPPSPAHPTHNSLRKHGSFSSTSSRSSRSSLSGSQASTDLEKDRVDEEEEVVVHERERNWNNPHPHWTKRHSYQGSPRPESPAASVTSSTSYAGTRNSPAAHAIRVRAESLKEKAHASPSPSRVGAKARQPTPNKVPLRNAQSSSNINSPSPARKAEASDGVENLSSSMRRISPAKPSTPAEKPVPIPIPAVKSKTPQPQLEDLSADMSEEQEHPEIITNSHSHSHAGVGLDGARFGWKFPRAKSPVPPVALQPPSEDDLSPPPSPSRTRRPVTPTGQHRSSHIPVRSPGKGSKGLETSPRKGHKRTTTELADAVGRLPPSVNPKISPLFDGVDLAASPAAGSDAGSSPRQATPRLRPTATLAVEPLATPPSSPERQVRDEDRLQKALSSPAPPQPETPPASPPLPPGGTDRTPSSSVLATPTRASSSTPRLEFETPSPPKGMPDLPDPPSDEDDTMELPPRTPLKFNGFANAGDFSSMKTPRPPGAWAATPLPARQDEPAKASAPAFNRPQTSPGDSSGDSVATGLATPASTLSRAHALPPQTPAPPGGWLATPYTGNRKSIMKVRFDVEASGSEGSVLGGASVSEAAESEVSTEPSSPVIDPAEGPSEVSHLEFKHIDRIMSARASLTPSPEREHKDEGDDTPRMRSAPLPSTAQEQQHQWSPKRSVNVRMLDAYGREQPPSPPADVKPETSIARTSRNKSGVRMLDAFGREIEEESVVSQSEDEGPLSHNDALARLRAGVADLRAELSDADRSLEPLSLRDSTLAKLDEMSSRSRAARRELAQKLVQTMDVTRDAEEELKGKYGSLSGKLLSSSMGSYVGWRSLPTWLFWSIVLVQFILVVLMYRMSAARARAMFLSTYYDPFEPAMHLHAVDPHFVRNAIWDTSSSTWSVFTITDSVQRAGWKGAFADFYGNATLIVQGWQHRAWEAWGTDTRPTPWPPT